MILEVDTQSAAGSWLENNDFIVYGGVGYPVNLIYDKDNNKCQDPIMPSILAGVDFVIPKSVWGSHFTVGAVLGYTATQGRGGEGVLIIGIGNRYNQNRYKLTRLCRGFMPA